MVQTPVSLQQDHMQSDPAWLQTIMAYEYMMTGYVLAQSESCGSGTCI